MVDEALEEMSPRFERIYSRVGRPSIAPEKLLRALLLQVFYSIRSERLLMEQLDYNLLFRWFVGLEMDDAVWDATVFTKNRDRLLDGEIAEEFFARVLDQARAKELLSDEHFTVDGTLIEAWASQKSFRPKDDDGATAAERMSRSNPEVDFHGQKRTNDTHESTTDPEARLYKKPGRGGEARLPGPRPDGESQRLGGRRATHRGQRLRRTRRRAGDGRRLPEGGRITLGADKGYDEAGFVERFGRRGVTPHVARRRPAALDGRTTRHRGLRDESRARKRIEEIFGWMKTIGVMRKTRHRGKRRVGWMFTLTAAAYNLVRMRNLAVAVT